MERAWAQDGWAPQAMAHQAHCAAYGAVFAVGALLFAAAPNYASLFIIAIPFGLAVGIFLSADWALLADTAPDEQTGRYLGLSNTVTAGATVVALAIGGPLADIVNGVLFKSLAFGAVVSLIAVFQGFATPPTSEGVARATTRTVVASSIAILALDFVLTAFLM